MLPALITFSMLGTFMNIKLLTSILQSFNDLIISEDFLTRHRIGNAFICSGKLSFSNLIYFVLQSVHTSIPINYSRFLDDFSSELPPFVSKQAFSKAKQGISHKAFLELFRFSVKQFYFQTADLRTWNSFHIFRINENWRWAKQTKVHKHNPKGVLKRKESFRIFYAESEGIAQSSNLMILRHSLPNTKNAGYTSVSDITVPLFFFYFCCYITGNCSIPCSGSAIFRYRSSCCSTSCAIITANGARFPSTA